MTSPRKFASDGATDDATPHDEDVGVKSHGETAFKRNGSLPQYDTSNPEGLGILVKARRFSALSLVSRRYRGSGLENGGEAAIIPGGFPRFASGFPLGPTRIDQLPHLRP